MLTWTIHICSITLIHLQLNQFQCSVFYLQYIILCVSVKICVVNSYFHIE